MGPCTADGSRAAGGTWDVDDRLGRTVGLVAAAAALAATPGVTALL
jgi:hypothetical protein